VPPCGIPYSRTSADGVASPDPGYTTGLAQRGLQGAAEASRGKTMHDYFSKRTLINAMDKKKRTADIDGRAVGNKSKAGSPGYPRYPSNEDIFNKYKEEENLNPEDTSKSKAPNDDGSAGKNNEKDFDGDASGGDLDVPGSELDDEQESIGSEDEENNYYSLGGDDHNDLEEDRGD
jgi:hypothetical protein